MSPLPFPHGGDLTSAASASGMGRESLLDFSASVNPLGFSPEVARAIVEGIGEIGHYPDPHSTFLRDSLAQLHGLEKERLLVGCGSTEFIYLLPRALKPKKVLIVEPTYVDYYNASMAVGAEVKRLLAPREKNFHPPLEAIRKDIEEADLLFLCNPNNPTGQLLRAQDVMDLAQRAPHTLVVVDEAFIDFCPEPSSFSVLSRAGTISNLLVMRSMTKYFAIPGLRLGFLVAPEAIIERLMSCKEPWTVNCFAQGAGLAALKDLEFYRPTREVVKQERDFLFSQLALMEGLRPYPSMANFLLVEVSHPQKDSAWMREALLKRGILVRDCSNFYGLDSRFFRVAVRNRHCNLSLLESLRSLMDGQR